MINQHQVGTLTGRDVYDRDGDKIGTVGQIWADSGGQPAWASVRTGFLEMGESLVPLQKAELRDERLTLPFDKGHVKDAPHVDVAYDEPLSGDEVGRLYEHYGLDRWRGATADSDGYDASYAGAVAPDNAGRGADDAMTRSEERLRVDTERERAGTARLRKYVVTEQQQVSVPVRHEEVRLEREPITGDNIDRAMDGPAISEEEHEVTLHAERPVVNREAVPVERVRLGKETVTDAETVGGAVRKEHIEADLPRQGRRDVG